MKSKKKSSKKVKTEAPKYVVSYEEIPQKSNAEVLLEVELEIARLSQIHTQIVKSIQELSSHKQKLLNELLGGV